jgi:hypothetical protein
MWELPTLPYHMLCQAVIIALKEICKAKHKIFFAHSVADIFKCDRPTVHWNKQLTITTVPKIIELLLK